jgi:hypothetical protein
MHPERKLLLLAALAGALVPSGLGKAREGPRSPGQSPGKCPCSADAPVLAVHVASFKVESKNMAEALLALRVGDVKHIVIGFERVPHAEGEEGGHMSLAVTDTTLGEVVRRLCQADPRYEYQVVQGAFVRPDLEGSMIEVYPRGALEDPTDLLNIRVREYKVDANITADAVFQHLGEDVPELRDFLRLKRDQWLKERGPQRGGSIGPIMSGNMLPPRFTLHLHDVTLRQILDAISTKSIEMFKEGPDFDSSGRGVKWAPTGWEYDFVIDPNAGTGLGGYPKWEAF